MYVMYSCFVAAVGRCQLTLSLSTTTSSASLLTYNANARELRWVKAHVSISGNETADQCAKAGRTPALHRPSTANQPGAVAASHPLQFVEMPY